MTAGQAGMNDILAELTQLKADHSAAQTLLEEAKTAKEAFDGQLAAKHAVIAEKEGAIAKANEAFAAKEQELAQQVADFNAVKAELESLKASQKSAEQKAVELVANQGIAPLKVDTKDTNAALTKAEALAQYNAIKDPVERAHFYHANKATIYGK